MTGAPGRDGAMSLTIWTNHEPRPEAREILAAGLAQTGCRLVQSVGSSRSVLAPGASDPALAAADIAYGQPAPEDVMQSPRLKWLALSTAGYARYDREDFRQAMQQRGTPVSNASAESTFHGLAIRSCRRGGRGPSALGRGYSSSAACTLGLGSFAAS